MSTKFTLQTRCNYRQNLPCKHNAIDYMHGSPIAQRSTNSYCAIEKFVTFSTSKFTFSALEDHKPTKTKPKIKMKLFIPKNFLSSASMTSTELLRWDDVETRPFPPKIHGQMTDGSRIPLIVDFGRNRRLRIPIATVLLNCYTACLLYTSPSPRD